MFPPASHPAYQARVQAQAQEISSSSSLSAVTGPPIQTLQDVDAESDEENRSDGLGASISATPRSTGKGKERVIVRIRDSKCFLQSVVELRTEINKARHERTFFTFSLVLRSTEESFECRSSGYIGEPHFRRYRGS